MYTWAMDYWYLCLAALIIGVATAAWIWLRADARADDRLEMDEPPTRVPAASPAPPLQPVKPVIDVAQPVAFTAPQPAPAPVAAVPAAAAPSSAAPVAAAPLAAIPPAQGAPDDLTLLKGVGPKLNALLNSLGVFRFDQIAAWGTAEIANVDAHLGTFRGRITRDNWVDQAGMLARGDHAAFTARYGELGSENR